MHFYYFMIKKYGSNYQQAKCIASFIAMLLPVLAFEIFIRDISSPTFHATLFLGGWCTWTFVEYILHRFWMHDKNSNSSIAKTHHYHHTHPTEIAVTNFHRGMMVIVLAALVLTANYLANYFTFLVGFFFGLEGYFLMHIFLHLKIAQRIFKRLVRYHIYHHCKYPNTCFGVSVPWWDDLFKTIPQQPKIAQRIIDFYFKDHDGSADQSAPDHASIREPKCIGSCSCKVECVRASMRNDLV